MKRKLPSLKFYQNTLKCLLTLFVLFSQNMLYPQVKIKEKLEINPKPKNSHLINTTMQVSHTMRFAVHWDAVVVEANNHFVNANINGRIIVKDYYNPSIIIAVSDWTRGWPAGDMSISMNNAVCDYQVEIQFEGFYGEYQFINLKTNVYWDETLADVFTDKVQSRWYYHGDMFGGGAGYYGSSTIYGMNFRAGYKPYIRVPNCLDKPIGVGINYTCDGTIFYPKSDPLTITILQGDDLFWFYTSQTCEYFEKTVSGLLGVSYVLVPKGPLPRMDSLEIILQFQIKDDIQTCSQMLYNINDGGLYGYSYANRINHNSQTEIECVLYKECGQAPTDVTMNAEIKKGSQYGVLVDPLSGNSGRLLTGLKLSNRFADILFFANGKSTAIEDTIIIELTASRDNIVPGSVQLIMERDPIKISLEPSEISPGDTAIIKLEKWNSISKSYTEMSEGEIFELGIQEGCLAGGIVPADGNKTNYYKGNYSSTSRLKFVAADSLNTDSISVVLRAGFPDGIPAILANGETIFEKSSPEKMAINLISSNETNTIKPGMKNTETCNDLLKRINEDKKFGRLSAAAKETIIAILINRMSKASASDTSIKAQSIVINQDNGQTCSGVNYQYPEKGSGTELIVKPIDILLGETKYFQTKLNDKNELIIEEVKVEPGKEPQCTGIKEDVWGTSPAAAIAGNKCGVYWDKKSSSGNDLSTGLIRLVGRYWEKNKTYKVNLAAFYGSNKSANIIVDVIKPGKLGSSNNYANDVLGNQICIDDICIEAGGKNGIPPQLIKGQMQKETNFKNVFRYEPFVDINYQTDPATKKVLFEDYDYFVVSQNNMGTITIPTSHTNVSPIPYPNQPVKISDFIVENIGQYIQKPNKAKEKLPTVVGDEKLTKRLRNAYSAPRVNKTENSLSAAVEELKNYLKSGEYEGGNKYAQTRIIASYGMLQQTFYDAFYRKLAGFSVSNPSQSPELLNEKDYSIKSYSERILKVLNNKAGSIWNGGYEKGWLKALSGYNPGESGYGNDVLNNSKSFLPVK